ncbi:hypothetical protein [Nonomuraea recticatena]|uniref:hypothetical protein n=1 Tax=Nonomuraea recticatena TaxID=46178 RepID=UPI00360943FC
MLPEAPSDTALLAVPYDSGLNPRVELPVPAAALMAHHAAKGEAGEIVEVPVSRGDSVGGLLLYGVGDGSPAPCARRPPRSPAGPRAGPS